jgi:glycosyltransferase involved in cell wall biosynthesis
MRCLIFIPCLLNGGTERQTLSLCKALLLNKVNVIIFCYFEYNITIVNEFEKSGVEVKLLKLNRKIGFIHLIYQLKDQISMMRPDVIHVQYMSPGAIPIIAARLAGVKTIFATVHQPYTNLHGKSAKIILRLAHLLTTRFIAVSQNTEKSWFGSSSLFEVNKPPCDWGRHFTIYNSVDTARISEVCASTNIISLKKELSIPTGSIVIGTISRLRHEKGIDILIDSFISLKDEGYNIHLLIVGSGPDEEKLKQKISDARYQESVTFFGNSEWAVAIRMLTVIDIFVVPSRFEGFGLSAAEAMAAGKPVIASDAFGLLEVVDHEQTGLIFHAGDAYSLTKSIKKLLLEPGLRSIYGDKGLIKVKAKFDQAIMNNKVKVLYNN